MLTCRFVFVAVCLLPIVVSQDSPRQIKEFRQRLDLVHDSMAFIRRGYRKLDYNARALQMQTAIPISTPFPCTLSNGRSAVRPSSVHRLRPGDINVVGALGDSITAAYGAIALNLPGVMIGDRGHSFSGGGVETWRTVFTLPNVLKVYNPKLVGFSRGSGFSWDVASQLNIAEAFAGSVDLLHQAQLLVKRMKSDIQVDFERDWKMVTVLMGSNDICHWTCYEIAEEAVDKHRMHMTEMLDFLRDNVPRIFINLIPSPNLERIFFDKMVRLDSCYTVNQLECACLLGLQFKDKKQRLDAIMEEYLRVDKEITERPEYLNKEDFAVVFQPFLMNMTVPVIERLESEKPLMDPTFFAPDCFHFSQKLHSLVANGLWNNLMEPVGSKSQNGHHRLLEEFICPDEEHPYFFTAKNSV